MQGTGGRRGGEGGRGLWVFFLSPLLGWAVQQGFTSIWPKHPQHRPTGSSFCQVTLALDSGTPPMLLLISGLSLLLCQLDNHLLNRFPSCTHMKWFLSSWLDPDWSMDQTAGQRGWGPVARGPALRRLSDGWTLGLTYWPRSSVWLEKQCFGKGACFF